MLTALKWFCLAIWLAMIACIIFRPGNKPQGRFLWSAAQRRRRFLRLPGKQQLRRFVGQGHK